MRKSFATNWLAVAFGAALTVEALTGAAAAVPDYITAAIADSHRPAEDTTQDANRKPAAVLAFAAVKPGDTVIDLMPGVGYYTRLFSLTVGPKGRVIALQPVEMASGGQDQITER